MVILLKGISSFIQEFNSSFLPKKAQVKCRLKKIKQEKPKHFLKELHFALSKNLQDGIILNYGINILQFYPQLLFKNKNKLNPDANCPLSILRRS